MNILSVLHRPAHSPTTVTSDPQQAKRLPPAPPWDPPAGRTISTPLDYSSAVPLCVICIEASRATEATRQTSDMLCGCDEHIQQLEQHGRAAIHRQRKAVSGLLTASAAAAVFSAPYSIAETISGPLGAHQQTKPTTHQGHGGSGWLERHHFGELWHASFHEIAEFLTGHSGP
jgi:hypothetical protein